MKGGGKSSDVSQREKAKLMYLRSGCKKSLQIIAKEIGASYDTVKSWKRRDRWDEDPKASLKGANAPPHAPQGAPKNAPEGAPHNAPAGKRKKGAQPGNKNAVYGSGGSPAPGNQNAVTTGEYARILFTDLTDEERALLASMPEDAIVLMENDLGLLCVRERRMLHRIQELQSSAQNGMIFSEITSSASSKNRTANGHSESTEATYTTVAPAIDRIGAIEEALTRLRREKQRLINAIQKFKEDQVSRQVEQEKLGMERRRIDLVERRLNLIDPSVESDAMREARELLGGIESAF